MNRRLGAVGLSSALLLGGGSGLLAAALSGGSAGADSPFGGFTINALGEAFTAQYEQPNFPLPATPTLEFDEGYASTADNFGPTGTATASTFYPGQVVANAGPQLALLVPGVPIPPAPVWPIQAITDYPQTPNTKSLDVPGANMDATSNADGSQATSTVGNDAATAGGNGTQPTQAESGSGNPFASTSSIFGIGNVSATSSSGTTATGAVASATATDSGISILGGFINIGAVTSTATASSDGTNGTVTGSTTLTNVSIAGTQVTVTANGIQAAGKSAPLALPISALNTLLNELGVTLSVTNPTDKIDGAHATRTLDGLRVSINLDTLDNAANKLATVLPKSVTSQLPIALPNSQVLTLDLGTVSVSSAASPPFTDTGSTGSTDTSSTDSGSGGGFVSPSTSSSDLSGGSTFGGSTGSGLTGGGTTGTASTATGGNPSSNNGGGSGLPASAVTSAFKGIGSGLILLGVLASAAMAYAYKRADDASELVGTACADGDPLGSRFSDADDGTDDAGGFA
jgi:hypothetical protein